MGQTQGLDWLTTALNGVATRRRFLGLVGGTAALASMGGLLAACGSDNQDDDNAETESTGDDSDEEPAQSADEPEADDDAGGLDDDQEAVDESNGGRLIAVASVEPESLNPFLLQLVLSADILSAVMDSLLMPDNSGVYGPRLAESYDFSEDGLTCTLELRDDVTWHGGEEFSADDVVATYETIMDPEFGAFNPSGWEQISEVDTPDSHTVVFTLEDVFAPFIASIGDTFIAPAAAIYEGYDHFREDFGRQPWGTGPYIFEEWQSGEQLRLTANPDYWAGAPSIDEIIYRFVSSSSTMVVQLQSGEADMTAYATAEHYADLEEIEGTNVFVTESQAWFHLDLKNYGFLMDRNVRLALDHATPREDIVSQILDGLGTVSAGDISPVSWAHHPDIEPRPYDLDIAREFLDEAGWELGSNDVRQKDGQDLFIELWAVSGDSQTERVLQVIANSWRQIGFDVDVNMQDARTIWGPEGYQFSEVETAGAFSWFNDNDPDHSFYWHSSAIPEEPDGPGGNLVGYFNEFEYQDELDELLDQGAATIDRDDRREIYHEIQELLHEQAPVIYVYWENLIFVAPDNLEGFAPNAFSRLFYNVHEWRYTS